MISFALFVIKVLLVIAQTIVLISMLDFVVKLISNKDTNKNQKDKIFQGKNKEENKKREAKKTKKGR